MSFCKFVGSQGIKLSCKFVLSYPIGMSINGVRDGDTVYVNLSLVCEQLLNIIPCKIILVCGDYDHTFPHNCFHTQEEFARFINSDKIIHCFSQNCDIVHPKVTQIPIGLDYHTLINKSDSWWGGQKTAMEQERDLEEIVLGARPFWDREAKCYATFHFALYHGSQYGHHRVEAINKLKQEVMFYEPERVSRNVSHRHQTEYAFVISPFGNGMDCHRTWEALCLGCIVIVKTSPLDGLYDDLPVLIVNDWSDIDQILLENTIIKFRAREFKYEKLNLTYWQEIIKYPNVRTSEQCTA